MSVKKIAITGGIGSGKSTVSSIIKSFGFPVFSCDEIYAELLDNARFRRLIAEITGVPEITVNGKTQINRKAVSEKVFNSRQLKQALENATHPEIMKELLSRMDSEEGVAFAEVPLLFEGGFENLFDEVILVMRDKSARINSVIKRDGSNVSDVEIRIQNQFNYENFTLNGHTLIYNDSDERDLRIKVSEALGKIL